MFKNLKQIKNSSSEVNKEIDVIGLNVLWAYMTGKQRNLISATRTTIGLAIQNTVNNVIQLIQSLLY